MIKLMRSFCSILEKKDDFDWGKYLMEGEEVGLGYDFAAFNKNPNYYR